MIITRLGKGSPLTAEEHDNNLTIVTNLQKVSLNPNGQDVDYTSTKLANATYTNNKPYAILLSITAQADNPSTMSITMNDKRRVYSVQNLGNGTIQGSLVIPSGATYSAYATPSISEWLEYK